MRHLGIDVHQKYSEVCEISESGEVVGRQRIATTEASLHRLCGDAGDCRIVFECGSMTPWVYRLLRSFGHEVVVVNPRRVRLIAESTLKSDKVDAEILARLSRLDPELVPSVYQRSTAAQELRTRLKVRSSLVRARTSLINAVRGSLRSQGYRMGSCSSKGFVAKYATVKVDRELEQALDPLIATLAELSQRIGALDRELGELARSDDLLARLQTVPGVGPLVSLSFVAWVDRAERFARSRDVGPSLGLRPALKSSGGKELRGRVTREGDAEMRRLLVQAAHAALHSRKDFALKRWAESVERRVGKSKAIVALARKLAVLLHHLWIHDQVFVPFPKAA